jgi:hypothetical protein
VNDDTLVVVHAYSGDVDRVRFMLPKYLHHECPVLLLSPKDAAVRIRRKGVTCRSAGEAGWKGRHTLERQVEHLKLAAAQPQSFFLLHDSDSVCLYGEISGYLYEDAEGVFWSNEGCDSVIRKQEGSWTEQDEYNQTLQPPYFFNRVTLEKIIAVADEAIDLCNPEAGIDQFYAEVVRCAGLERKVYPDGIHRETRRLNELARVYYMARTYGTCMIHSVKTQDALDTLVTGLWEHDNGPEWGPGR